MTWTKTSLGLSAAMLLWALAGVPAGTANDARNHRVTGGLSVFLGVLPAAMVAGPHLSDHLEIAMHDGPPGGPHVQHVMVALFDTRTGARIEDAAVEAHVAPLGLAGVRQPLEPMAIADTITYGNYFNMPHDGLYQIRIWVILAGAARVTVLEFSNDHRTR